MYYLFLIWSSVFEIEVTYKGSLGGNTVLKKSINTPSAHMVGF